MANQYKNKVIYNGTTLMDISDTTAIASDVGLGKEFYTASGAKAQGTAVTGNAISIVDTTDTNGGTIRTITAVDISDTTAVAADVASGKYFYTANGTKTAGTASGGGGSSATLITKEITTNGTYTASSDSADGYSSVTVNVPSSGITPTGSLNISANGTYDVTNYANAVVSVSSGGTPSATAHTIFFEFADGTSATITSYWDSTFINDAITSTTPITYDSKVVNSASLDGVEWYNAVEYFVLYEGTPTLYTDTGNYFWIPELGNVQPTVGSVWRITIDGTEYNCIAQDSGRSDIIGVIVGNPVHIGGTDDGSGIPVAFYNYQNQAWSGDTTTITAGNHTVKIERQGTV